MWSSSSLGFKWEVIMGLWVCNSWVQMWELDHKEDGELKNWCFWTVVLEKTLKSPLDCRKTHPVYPERNQSWIFIGRTDAEAAILPTNWKRPWRWQRLKAGEWDNKGRDGWMASLTQWTWVWASCRRWWRTGKPGMLRPWGCKEVDTTERLNHIKYIQCLMQELPQRRKHGDSFCVRGI